MQTKRASNTTTSDASLKTPTSSFGIQNKVTNRIPSPEFKNTKKRNNSTKMIAKMTQARVSNCAPVNSTRARAKPPWPKQ